MSLLYIHVLLIAFLNQYFTLYNTGTHVHAYKNHNIVEKSLSFLIVSNDTLYLNYYSCTYIIQHPDRKIFIRVFSPIQINTTTYLSLSLLIMNTCITKPTV